jgi:hypothetical protein
MGKLRFEPLISVGTIIQLLALIASFAGLYHKIDLTLAIHNTKIEQQEKRITLLEKICLEKEYGNTKRQ